MDNISGLPDELLVRIISFVPTKVVSTSILSNRWKFLWMWLPKLDFTARDYSLLALRDFINKNLPLHRAPIIESLRIALHETREEHITPQYIKLWVEIAVSRQVRELDISYSSDSNENMLPSSLFTCKSVVILKLSYVTLMDIPSMVCLPSLKTLQLERVIYADAESLQALLSICHVLEDLKVYFTEDDSMEEFIVIVPSLKKLSLHIHDRLYLDRYEIDTPCLEYLKLEDWNVNVKKKLKQDSKELQWRQKSLRRSEERQKELGSDKMNVQPNTEGKENKPNTKSSSTVEIKRAQTAEITSALTDRRCRAVNGKQNKAGTYNVLSEISLHNRYEMLNAE